MKQSIIAVILIALAGSVAAHDFNDVVPEALLYNHADDNNLAELYWKTDVPTPQPVIRNFETDSVYMHTDVMPDTILELY